jgi:23S rRNA (guanosine2251-2'-O)-methyltransferase
MAKTVHRDVILIVYNVRSLYNVGSIFRTADALGIKKIYLSGITPAPIDNFGNYRSKIKKVSLGAEKFVPWEKVAKSTKKVLSLIEQLKKEGYKILALEQAKTSVNIFKSKFSNNKKLCLIVGNEVSGLPAKILKVVDKILEIPMYGKKESLNVSVAFGVAGYQLIMN